MFLFFCKKKKNFHGSSATVAITIKKVYGILIILFALFCVSHFLALSPKDPKCQKGATLSCSLWEWVVSHCMAFLVSLGV